MKVTIEYEGRRYSAKVPFIGAEYVEVEGVCCGRVHGRGIRATTHDTYVAEAECECGKRVGTMHTKVSTIFGIEEDERVLYGRARVY